jgi:type I restriction enzyme R subunit
MRRINLRNGQPWLDDARLAQALGPLLRPQASSLIDVNRELTDALLSGAHVSAPEDENIRRDVRVHYIDWLRHEALGSSNGGERPLSPGRRSGRVKLRAA